MDENEIMMRIKQEVQEVYPDMDFGSPSLHHHRRGPHPGGEMDMVMDHHRGRPQHSRSPTPEDGDLRGGVKVKGGQMVMMPDMMEQYEDEEEDDDNTEARRLAEEEDMGSVERRNVDMSVEEEEEEKLRMYLKQRGYRNEEVGVGEEEEGEVVRRGSGDDSYEASGRLLRGETEAERELRAVQEKFEREQEEDMMMSEKKEKNYKVLPYLFDRDSGSNKENNSGRPSGYPPSADDTLHSSHYASQFSPLNLSESESKSPSGGNPLPTDHTNENQNNFMGEDGRSSNRESTSSTAVAAAASDKAYYGMDGEEREEEEEGLVSKSQSQPFVVQLPDSGPVFPSRQSSPSPPRSPPVDSVAAPATSS